MIDQLRELVARLAGAEVRFVLVGGYAATSHGSSLVTRDVDVALDLSPENLKKLHDALQDLNPHHRMGKEKRPFTEQDASDPNWKNLYLTTDWGQLDCLGEVAGIGSFEDCEKKSEVLDLGDFQLRILTLDALIEAKRAIGRPKDIHAVHELEAIRELREKRMLP